MKLTDAKCRNAKATGAVYKMTDGHGLYLYVTKTGSRLWRMDYRFEGRYQTMSFGPYPEITLAEAREKRDEARKSLRKGVNPMDELKAARFVSSLARAQTFGLVADELLAKLEREKKSPVTIAKRRWMLKELAKPLLNRPVSAITASEILIVLRRIEVKGHLETARRLRASIGQVMRLAVATDRAMSDPTPALRGAIASPKTTHRAAITDPKGAARLMKAIRAYDRPIVRASMLLLAYCFPRPGECRMARWPEIDLENAVWVIPAERTKMRREHKIPLSRQAVEVFRELHAVTGANRHGLCFPGERALNRPISENTVCAALRVLGFGQDEMSAHGFRSLASSLLHEESEFSSEVIERALGHQDQNAVRRAYARGEHWKHRVQLAQWWADYLDGLSNRSDAAHNVA